AVVAGPRAVRHTAATPVRRPDRTLPRAAGALLPPRLGAAARHLGARLGAVRARALRRELRGDGLVHHRDVRLDTEDLFRQGHARTGAAVGLLHGETGHATPAFTALRTKTSPPFGPGTAPRMSSRLRSASPSTTWRFSVVTRVLPYWP